MEEKKEIFVRKPSYGIYDLVDIMELLRSEENGCPWDREQTHESIRANLIEEAYEAAEAIDEKDAAMQKEELGDLLLQVIFHARIGEESGEYDIDGIADGICRKLILRHPHIFGDVKADSSEEVLNNWEKIKIVEKGFESDSEYIKSVPKSLPALMRAQKTHKRMVKRNKAAKNVNNNDETVRKLTDLLSGNGFGEDALGELLFNISAAAENLKIDAEEALYKYNQKILLEL